MINDHHMWKKILVQIPLNLISYYTRNPFFRYSMHHLVLHVVQYKCMQQTNGPKSPSLKRIIIIFFPSNSTFFLKITNHLQICTHITLVYTFHICICKKLVSRLIFKTSSICVLTSPTTILTHIPHHNICHMKL